MAGIFPANILLNASTSAIRPVNAERAACTSFRRSSYTAWAALVGAKPAPPMTSPPPPPISASSQIKLKYTLYFSTYHLSSVCISVLVRKCSSASYIFL